MEQGVGKSGGEGSQLELREPKAELSETTLHDRPSEGLITHVFWSLGFILEQQAATEGLLGELLQAHSAHGVENGLAGQDGAGGRLRRPELEW